MKIKDMEYGKHYQDKKHTKHYYLNLVFTNREWEDYRNGKTVLNNIVIGVTSKYRYPPKQCDRWYNMDNGRTKIVKHCENEPFYKTKDNLYFCKYCARKISKINDNIEFDKIRKPSL